MTNECTGANHQQGEDKYQTEEIILSAVYRWRNYSY